MSNLIKFGPFEIEYEYSPGDAGTFHEAPTGCEWDTMKVYWRDDDEFESEMDEFSASVSDEIEERAKSMLGHRTALPKNVYSGFLAENYYMVADAIEKQEEDR